MPVTLPNIDKIAAGYTRSAAIIVAIFRAIAAKFDAGIVAADISPTANIPGTCLATNSTPGDRVQDGTITLAKMGAASVGTTQLVDLGVTKGKMTTTVGSRATKAQLEISVFSGTAGFTIGGSNTGFAFTAELGTQVVSGTNSWTARIRQIYYGGGLPGAQVTVVAPGTAIPVASTTVLAIVLKNPTFSAGGGQCDFDLYYIANT